MLRQQAGPPNSIADLSPCQARWLRILPFLAQDHTADWNVSWNEGRLLQLSEQFEAALAGDDAVGAVRGFADHDDAMPALGRCCWL